MSALPGIQLRHCYSCHTKNRVQAEKLTIARCGTCGEPLLGNLYNVLGVERKVSPTELKQAYRRSIRQLHPDVGSRTNDTNAEQLQHIILAYRTLSDRSSRDNYDKTLTMTAVPIQPQSDCATEPSASPAELLSRREIGQWILYMFGCALSILIFFTGAVLSHGQLVNTLTFLGLAVLLGFTLQIWLTTQSSPGGTRGKRRWYEFIRRMSREGYR